MAAIPSRFSLPCKGDLLPAPDSMDADMGRIRIGFLGWDIQQETLHHLPLGQTPRPNFGCQLTPMSLALHTDFSPNGS
jgi:hypothetical protein